MSALLPLFLGVPIVASGLCMILPWVLARRIVVYTVPVAALVGGLALVDHHATVSAFAAVNVGSYVPGVAIPFASDSFSALMVCICALVSLLAIWFADLTRELTSHRFYQSLVLLLLGGVFGALFTADLFNLFVMVEVMLMPSYALLALAGTRRRISAGRLFVVINLLTSTLLVAGVGLVYGVAGTVNLPALAGAAREDGRLAFALGLVVLALCIKAGAMPVHGWLPQTYPATSPAVMALFSGLHTKVALYAVLRIWAVAFDLDPTWGWLILGSALTTTVLGAIASTAGGTARTVLAWQMVSGVGVILASLAVGITLLPGETGPQLATPVVGAALTGAIVYMIHHMLTMGGLIAGFGALEHRYGTDRLSGRPARFGGVSADAVSSREVLSGLWWRERPVAIALLVLISSLVGLPLTSGLIGKFEVVRAAAAAGGWTGYLTVLLVLFASVVGLTAMVRLWSRTMWDAPRRRAGDSAPASAPGSDSDSDSESTPAPAEPRTAAPGAPATPRSGTSRLVTAPAFVFAACSVAMFLCYSPIAKVVDRAVVDLVDTRGYVMEVLGPDSVDGRYMLPPLGSGTEFRPLAGDDAREQLPTGGR